MILLPRAQHPHCKHLQTDKISQTQRSRSTTGLEIKAKQSHLQSPVLPTIQWRNSAVRWEVGVGFGILIIVSLHPVLFMRRDQKSDRSETIIKFWPEQSCEKPNQTQESPQPLCTQPAADALQCCLHKGLLRWSRFKCLWHVEIVCASPWAQLMMPRVVFLCHFIRGYFHSFYFSKLFHYVCLKHAHCLGKTKARTKTNQTPQYVVLELKKRWERGEQQQKAAVQQWALADVKFTNQRRFSSAFP